MAKLVIGANKTNGVPAIVKEVSTPSVLGTKTITTNGTYNASSDNYDGYSSVTVNVPTVSEPYLELEISSSVLRNSRTTARLLPLSGFADIYDFVLAGAYRNNTAISGGIVFSDLTQISGTCACYAAFRESNISSASAPNLQTISGAQACQTMFASCSYISSAGFPNLETISGSNACNAMFLNSSVSTINLLKLKTISGNNACDSMFERCSNLQQIVFTALDSLTGMYALRRAFANSGITSISFPALKSTSFGTYKNQFSSMLDSTTDCMIHFPTNLNPALGSTVISSLTGYPDFGGTHTQLSFDLPATE